MNNIKVAIVHDWLTGMRGGEKCLEVFCELFPEAHLFTLLHAKGSVSPVIENMQIHTSFLQNMPGIAENYRNFLPLFPTAIESFDLKEYDLVLSSSHCVAKGVRSREDALHICYCYTPVRYAWMFFDEYFGSANIIKKWIISRTISSIRKWDLKSNKRVNCFVAISDNIRKRIKRLYDREADVIYPPVDVDAHIVRSDSENKYLIVSAPAPYKRVDLAIEAFNKSGKRLVVAGSGGDLKSLKKRSRENIEFLGWVDDAKLSELYSSCQALVFPGEEDFGIVPVEAQAHGKPVIAYASGGVLETVVPLSRSEENPTGVFFNEQTPDALNGAIEEFEKSRAKFNADNIRKNTLRFNVDRFRQEIKEYVEEKYSEHHQKKTGSI
ncbi:MAG: glycosyltransferase [Candidatus Omnitrophota bacterium]